MQWILMIVSWFLQVYVSEERYSRWSIPEYNSDRLFSRRRILANGNVNNQYFPRYVWDLFISTATYTFAALFPPVLSSARQIPN